MTLFFNHKNSFFISENANFLYIMRTIYYFSIKLNKKVILMRILRQLIGAIRKIVEFWTPSGIADRKYKWQGAGFAGDGSESEGAKSAKRYFLGLNIDEQEPELRNIIEYFKNDDNPITMFPGNFTKKYRIDYDKACKMNYVFYENKKMFFPKGWSTASIRRYYDELRMEQDQDSPHRYEQRILL